MRARSARRAAAKDGGPAELIRPVQRDRSPRGRPTPSLEISAPTRRPGPARPLRLRLRRAAKIMGIRPSTVRALATQGRAVLTPEVHMAELRTVFEMSRRRSSLTWTHGPAGRKAPACRTPSQGRGLGVGSVIVAAIALFASVALDRARDGTFPAIPPGSRSAPTFTIVGTDGSIVAATPRVRRHCDAGPVARWHHDRLHHPRLVDPRVPSRHDACGRTGFHVLTNDPIAAKQPRWSPDGTRLVYFRQDAAATSASW